ncbi:MAG: hypothetical protein QOF51_328 [Chloroflexota bacterium]|nr:hypothetical protein [Chloroflexota bacterium]
MQRAERSIRVAAPADRVYQFWRNFENLPQFMEHVQEVQSLDADHRLSHWQLKGPLGMTLEYDAEVVEDIPNKSIGWRSREGGDVGVSGNVTFTELDNNETQVHVVMQWFDPPAGPIGEALSRMLQNPERMLEEDLHRFKKVIESNTGSQREARVA